MKLHLRFVGAGPDKARQVHLSLAGFFVLIVGTFMILHLGFVGAGPDN